MYLHDCSRTVPNSSYLSTKQSVLPIEYRKEGHTQLCETVQYLSTMAAECDKKKSLFRDINAEDEDPEVTEIESVCMNCEENVSTLYYFRMIHFRMLPYSPGHFFNSFNCES